MKILSVLKICLLLSVVVAICLTSGCSSYYYMPNTQNVPLMKEKGDVSLLGAISSGDDLEAVEVQGAYAVASKFAVMANTQFVKEEEGDIQGRGHMVEGGVGYFVPLSEKIVFEVYGGLGGGRVRNDYDRTSSSSMKMNKMFIQPQLGMSSKHIDLAISTRLAKLGYSEIQTLNAGSNQDIIDIMDNRNSLLSEAAFTARFGVKNVKFQAQYVAAKNWTFPELKMENNVISFGLLLDL
ncbi:MAG: hypothetical protein NXI20_22970 [bacterium]|nr:hypothetical protein [bacterium]